MTRYKKDNETKEIHGREDFIVEFNQNEQEGVGVGRLGTSGECPSLYTVLTEHKVYVINDSTGNIACQEDIKYEYQWYDNDGEPVDEDDPTKTQGKPTEPADGAVEDAINTANNLARGFMNGWRTRHRKGPLYSNIEKYSESLLETSSVKEIPRVSETNKEIQAVVEITNNQWGLPSDVYNWLSDHPTFEMVDITHATEDEICIVIDKDDSRAPKY